VTDGVLSMEAVAREPFTHFGRGWIYGVWYCGTSFTKAIYYGQYPATLVKRLQRIFPSGRWLHLCCGRCHIPGAVNVDLHALPEVDVRADVEALPFAAASFDVVLIDPPYSEEDASRYKVARLVKPHAVQREAARVLKPGGWLLWLDERYPSYRRKEWALRGLVSVITGFGRRTRVVAMWQRQAPTPVAAALPPMTPAQLEIGMVV
jgi:SAM-dependent methyltransferase